VDAAAPCTLEPAFPKEHPVSHRTPQSRPNPKIEERRLEIASPQFSPAYQEVYSQEAASPFIPASRVTCHVGGALSRISPAVHPREPPELPWFAMEPRVNISRSA